MKTLIIFTGTEGWIMDRLLPSLYFKGRYRGDVLLLDYEESKFNRETVKFLKEKIGIIYRITTKEYSTFTADRFRAFAEILKCLYMKYDIIMHIDGNDIDFVGDINPLFDLVVKDKVCVVKELKINKICIDLGWKSIETLPKKYWDSIKNERVINAAMFLGPAKMMYDIIKFISDYVENDSKFGSDQLILNALFYYENFPYKEIGIEWDYFISYRPTFRDGKYYFTDISGIEKEIKIIHYAGYNKTKFGTDRGERIRKNWLFSR